MGWTLLGVVMLFIIFGIVETINRPKQQKQENNITKNKKINPMYLTHIEGLNGYGKGVKVKFSKELDEIYIDGKHFLSVNEINSITLNSSKQLIEQQKSVLKRSLAGAIIGGEIGAVIGGISGVGTTQKEETIWVLTINYKLFQKDKVAIFAIENESIIINKLKTALNIY